MQMEEETHSSGSVFGIVRGPHNEEAMVCQFVHMVNSRGGVWYGSNMFGFTLPVIMLQFIIMFFTSSIVWWLTKPFKQGLLSAQLIAGIILGSSFLGRIHGFSLRIFPPGARLLIETLANLGYMFHLFILGVHIDVSKLKRLRRNVVIIGTISYMFPFVVGFATMIILPQLIPLESSVLNSLPLITSTLAITAFPVTTSLLADLKILNSEIGRIATSTSLVCDLCNYIVSLFLSSMMLFLVTLRWEQMMTGVSFMAFIIMVVFLLRPLILQIAKGVPEGEQLKEGQFLAIMLIVIICGILAESFGQPMGFATFFLGVVIPDGPPFGSSLVNKLDPFCSGLLLPAKIMITGLIMDIHAIKEDSGTILGMVILFCYSVKFIGTVVPALYYEIPFKEAVSLALIMCCRGIIEVGLYVALLGDGIINSEAYALLIISMLIVTGMARPLICWLYDPSMRYLSSDCRKSILNSNPNKELRVLVCIHNEENVPAIIDILRMTNPTKFRPVIVFVVNLMELKGTANSLLEPSSKRSKLYSLKSWPRHVENAFNMFAHGSEGGLCVRHFTCVAPYASMHDDICTLALDQEASIVIVPFHKQWTIDGEIGTISPSIRMVNQNVISKSPCSVGLLVDRGHVYGRHSILREQFTCRITLLFLGGPDDCEALAYCNRLAENSQIYFTLIRIYEFGYDSELDMESLELDLVNELKAKSLRNGRIRYQEEFVKDAIGTTRVIASMEECDLCVVGRYHEPESTLLRGLTDWNECPELGLVGDMLVTSEFKFSVLIVQQHLPGSVFHTYDLRSVASTRSHTWTRIHHDQQHFGTV